MIDYVSLDSVNKRRMIGHESWMSFFFFFEAGEGGFTLLNGSFKVLSPICHWSVVLPEFTLGFRALSSELFMQFQWHSRNKRL